MDFIDFVRSINCDAILFEVFRLVSFALAVAFFTLWALKELHRQWQDYRGEIRRAKEANAPKPPEYQLNSIMFYPSLEQSRRQHQQSHNRSQSK